MGKFWTEVKTEYRRRRGELIDDAWDLTWKPAPDDFPRWSFYERRDIRNTLRNSNPLRFARLERDMIWLRKQCMKHGLPPENARYLV